MVAVFRLARLLVQHMLMVPHVPEQKALVVVVQPIKHPEPHHRRQRLPDRLVPTPRLVQLQPLVNNLLARRRPPGRKRPCLVRTRPPAASFRFPYDTPRVVRRPGRDSAEFPFYPPAPQTAVRATTAPQTASHKTSQAIDRRRRRRRRRRGRRRARQRREHVGRNAVCQKERTHGFAAPPEMARRCR